MYSGFNSVGDSHMIKEPIDAVVMWVNGDDPAHRIKRRKFQDVIEDNHDDCGILEGRFIDVGEVRYCIYSIRKFAPWIRKIFLVTDDQCPGWLTEQKQAELQVTVVDHKVIFRDHLFFLPTFNTMSILSLLWKIPGIANNYITFNDDNFIISNVYPGDFFTGDKTVLRGGWKLQNPAFRKKLKRYLKLAIKNKGLKNTDWKIFDPHIFGAKLAGMDVKYFETIHAPHTWRKDVQESYYKLHPEVLDKNVRYRFRNKMQFGPSALCAHLLIKTGAAIENPGKDSVMIIPRKGGLKDNRQKFDNLSKSNTKFLCFQDLYFLQRENPVEYREAIEYLERTIMG